MCFLPKNSFYPNANVKRGFCNKFNAKMYFFQFFSSLFYYSCDAIIIKNANFSFFFCLGRELNTFFFNILVANYFWSQKTTFCRYSEWKFKNDGFSLHPNGYGICVAKTIFKLTLLTSKKITSIAFCPC